MNFGVHMKKEDDNNLVPARISFEELKRVNQYGVEYWSARDLQSTLGYSKWQSFENAIEKAIESCKQSGNDPKHHFAGAGNPIMSGKGRAQVVEDYHLSRFACYLIAQNGDSRKSEIAHAQKYFAIQTRRQELSDAAIADLERVEMRKQASQDFKALSGAARDAGVQNKMFGIFHDAGYKGLYGGLGSDAIKARKGIDPKEQLMDRMDRTELAANQFRMTQTREKLKRENIKNQRDAIVAHETVGKEVRAAIAKIGGTPPENIPPVEHIKKVENRLKKTKPKLVLDDKNAGLSPQESIT
jgi:DNA-damage-inducible protein D